jgi:predicted O-methyltransferase YrrM
MNSLNTAPLSLLLRKLFADAKASDAVLAQQRSALSLEERTAQQAAVHSPSADYRAFYLRLKDAHLAVSAETGQLLYLLARSIKAHSIVEFGTSFGISTLHLAAALKDNGGGRLIGSEFEPSKIAHARENLATAALADLVEIREGDALVTLREALPQSIDLVLLDGAKPLYLKVLTLLEPRLHAGSLIVADNADWSPEYLSRVRAADGGYLSIPFREDVELSMRL